MDNSICNYNNSYRTQYDRNAQKLYCGLAQSADTEPRPDLVKEGYMVGGPPQRGVVDFPLKNAYRLIVGPVYYNSDLAPTYEGYGRVGRDLRGTIREGYPSTDKRGTIMNESFCPSCRKGGIGGNGITQNIMRPGI